MTTVVKVNLREPNYTLYIGRKWAGLAASKWANPFNITTWQPRDEVLIRYEDYIRAHPELMNALHEIDDQVLGCWCHPEPCHGDVLIKLRKEQIECKPSVTEPVESAIPGNAQLPS